MAKRDVIISALACGGKMSCRKEAELFKEPPLVININSGSGVSTGGGTVQGFRKAASEYKTNGSILKGLLSKQKNLSPRRICLISYLDGWSFINEILKTDDFDKIDTIIVLEGLNSRSVASPSSAWWRYIHHGNGRLVMACTQCTHKTASSSSMAKKVLALYDGDYNTIELPEYITNVDLESSISIYSKSETPKTKIFHKDPLMFVKTSGTVNYLQFSGKQSQDQTYIQQYVQPRLWRWLRDNWKNSTNVYTY